MDKEMAEGYKIGQAQKLTDIVANEKYSKEEILKYFRRK